MRPLYVVVHACTDLELCHRFFNALHECTQELKDLNATVFLVNDSPSGELINALTSVADELSGIVPCRVMPKQENVCASRSANRALKEAVQAGSDVVLLKSDVILYPGALSGMQNVGYMDPMVGFVSTRSNNAPLGFFPVQDEYRKLQPSEAYANFRELSRYLPPFHYVPTVDESCVFIKLEILSEFALDETYSDRDVAIDDLVMRANRCGYRAVLANHAFVYQSERAENMLERKACDILRSRYPEYIEHVQAYYDGAHYQAEALLTGLLKDAKDRYNIVFDFSHFGPRHNGTFEAARQILNHAANSWHDDFNIYVVVDDVSAQFHRLHEIEHVSLVPPTTNQVFAIAFRFGQPFEYQSLFRMSRLAVFNVFAMLDPIGWDCLYLHGADLDDIWMAVFSTADAITYNSDFVQREFRLRFRRHPNLKELAWYHSLDLDDYHSEKCVDELVPGGYVLVIGNNLAHKFLMPTVEALSREFPDKTIAALGIENVELQNVIGYPSGQLSEAELQSLFSNASVIIFPSMYEGFGIPVMRSLAARKPLLARSIPVNTDLFQKLGQPEDFILYESTEDLVARLRRGIPKWKNSVGPSRNTHNWTSSTEQLKSLFKELLRNVSFSDVLVPRLEHIKVLERSHNLNQRVSDLTASVIDQRRQINDLQTIIRDRDARIDGLLSSLSWAVTAPMRSAGALWLRAFSNKSRERK
jgi:glycosyltransferase involved in cell wall biosynthesis/GT2 family glycosyltransferase